MELKELLKKTRSCRRFIQEENIDQNELRDIVDNIRYTGSPANFQPLKFIPVNNREKNEMIFPHLKWAAYLTDWEGPEEGEKPAAYIVILGNRSMSLHIDWDYGIALQTILLSAREKGYGGCAIAACNKEKIREILDVPGELEIAAVVALGKPKEKVVIDDMEKANIKYWRDENDVHHVPKRTTDELIHSVFE
jgi:nitroreductase